MTTGVYRQWSFLSLFGLIECVFTILRKKGYFMIGEKNILYRVNKYGLYAYGTPFIKPVVNDLVKTTLFLEFIQTLDHHQMSKMFSRWRASAMAFMSLLETSMERYELERIPKFLIFDYSPHSLLSWYIEESLVSGKYDTLIVPNNIKQRFVDDVFTKNNILLSTPEINNLLMIRVGSYFKKSSGQQTLCLDDEAKSLFSQFHGFDRALIAIKNGYRARRSPWPENHYIRFLPNSFDHIVIIERPDTVETEVGYYSDEQEVSRPWLVKSEDLTAEDWVILD
jgi:hypothetical protein